MKKFLSLVLLSTLLLGTFACTNNIVTSNNTKNSTTNNDTGTKNTSKNSEINNKIKSLFQKDIFKIALNGKTISQAISNAIKNMSEDDKKEATAKFPELSLENSNFENDETTYKWLTSSLKIVIKNLIDSGEITQEQVDSYKGYTKILGITFPEVEIKKGMSDDDIEKLCLAFLDIADKFTEPETLKIIGVDIENPQTIEKIKGIFNTK